MPTRKMEGRSCNTTPKEKEGWRRARSSNLATRSGPQGRGRTGRRRCTGGRRHTHESARRRRGEGPSREGLGFTTVISRGAGVEGGGDGSTYQVGCSGADNVCFQLFQMLEEGPAVRPNVRGSARHVGLLASRFGSDCRTHSTNMTSLPPSHPSPNHPLHPPRGQRKKDSMFFVVFRSDCWFCFSSCDICVRIFFLQRRKW